MTFIDLSARLRHREHQSSFPGACLLKTQRLPLGWYRTFPVNSWHLEPRPLCLSRAIYFLKVTYNHGYWAGPITADNTLKKEGHTFWGKRGSNADAENLALSISAFQGMFSDKCDKCGNYLIQGYSSPETKEWVLLLWSLHSSRHTQIISKV